MLVYKLDKNIPAEKILNDINKMISKSQIESGEKLLVISIKNIIQTVEC